jgi:cytochrome c-type biogenesis protein CcmH
MRLVILAGVLAIAGSVAAADIEQRARELEAMLIAPCCFSQQVSVHQSPAASEVRQDIRKRLAAGQTREHILDAYVAQYGPRILSEPPAEGMTRVLYILPLLAFVVTAGLVVMRVRRFTAPHASDAPVAHAAPSPADERHRAQLDEELRDLD